MNNYTEFLAFAERLADAAEAAILPFLKNGFTAEQKADTSPVTEADKAAEAAMRALIEAHHPSHGIFGEEFGMRLAHAANTAPHNYIWVLDPIDGTRAFIEGRDAWGTLIALCENSEPVLGVLHQPTTGDRWLGVKDKPSTCNGAPCKTSTITTLEEARFSTTSADYFSVTEASRIAKLAETCKTAERNGDCIAYGMLATGMRDIVIDVGLKPYDILALAPIITGAGGIITTKKGEPITLANADSAIACNNAVLHTAVKQFLGW